MLKSNHKIWPKSFKWQFEAYPFFCSVWHNAAKPTKNKFHTSWNNFLCYFHNGYFVGLKPEDSIMSPGRTAIDGLLNGKNEFLNQFKKIHKEMRRAIEVCLKTRKANDLELEKWWPQVHKSLSDASGILFGFDFALNELLEKMQNNFSEEFKILNQNINAEELSFINEAEKKLLFLKNNRNDFEELYDEFIKEYGWFQNSYKGIFKISRPWLKNYLETIKKTRRSRIDIKPGKLPKKYKLLVKTASVGIVFRDDKKKLLLLGVELMEKWLKEICRKNGWKFEEMRWLSIYEILDLLSNKHSRALDKAKGCAKKNSRYGIYNEKGYDEVDKNFWKNALLIQNLNNADKEIRGLCANKGIYIGKIKVILNPKAEIKKFNENDILVTSMTRPEFLPLMKKAAAFVTDEGGITCHAAIVAREMGKPCIIGTKIATKVLKDGDMVEVDADKGVVRILK